jgi:REP element-mobilizing transposase RayT
MYQQLVLRCFLHGGKRKGAGRKPKGEHPLMPHARRDVVRKDTPLHITVRLAAGLPNLRRPAEMVVIRAALRAARGRSGLRLVHYSVLGNHLHLIVEAPDRESVSRGMNGLLVRLAKNLNRLWKRRGKVFPDRYHEERITTPTQARNALRYVLNNAQKHGLLGAGSIDPCSSALAFDGWKQPSITPRPLDTVLAPEAWLLRSGWRKQGLLDLFEIPRSRPAVRTARAEAQSPDRPKRTTRGKRPQRPSHPSRSSAKTYPGFG